MMRSPLGRLLSLLLTLAVVGGIAYYGINKSTGAVKDTSSGGSSSGSGAPSQNPGDSLFETSSLEPAVAAVRAEAGSDDMLEATVVPTLAKFTLRKGNTEQAYGQQWNAGGDSLQPLEVNIVGSGKISPQAYPISQLQANVPQKLIASVRKAAKLPDGEVQVMTLKRNPASGGLQWTVVITGGGRTLTAQAKPDGSGVKVL